MPTIEFKHCLFIAPLLMFLSVFQANASPAWPDADERQTTARSVFDLRDKTWEQGNAFELKGYWQFSWQQLASSLNDSPLEWTQMHVPGSWDLRYAKGPLETESLPAKGYGTYFVRILVPKHLSEVYLHLPDMASAYELWHWGEKLGGNGQIGQTKTQEQPGYLPKVYKLTSQQGVVDIFIKTSNFHYQWGGLWYAPKVSDKSGLFQLHNRPQMIAIGGGTILLTSAIFCFLLYLSRPQDRKILYFSLFCLAIGIRRLSIDERVLYLTPYFDWETLQATENISMYLMLPFFLGYFRHAFPEAAPKYLTLLGTIVSLPFCFIVLVTEVEFYSTLNRPFQATLIIFVPLVLYSWHKALRSKYPSAKTFGASLLIFLLTIINDILNYNYVIETTNMTHMGALAFVLFQIAALIQRYLKNFKKIETLSESLARQNEELRQMDRFKDDFLANTSHELRTPLHGIAGLAKTVQQEAPKLSTDAQNRIKLIGSTAKRLGHLVNDILDASSMKHGKLKLHTAPTHLRPLIETTVQSLRPLIKSKAVQLDFSVDDNANQVLADEQRLQQILFNLIGNAIKFTDQGNVFIEAHKSAEDIIVRVSDTGRGIPEEKLNTVLMPFENANGNTSEIRGTGLGLSITKMLVELHGGKLSIESKQGVGTQAEFSLPFTEQSPLTLDLYQEAKVYEEEIANHSKESIVEEPLSIHENKLTQGALIYFADDEEVNRLLVSGQLKQANYDIETFPSGEALLDRLEDQQPELILLDWMMPGKNGLEVCKEIRQRFDRYDIPVMMLTAKHQIADIVQALSLGANDYLVKPYHEQELLARVNSQLSVKRLITTAQENEKLMGEIALQEESLEQLNVANQRLSDALNSTPESVILLNEDLDIVTANSKANQILDLEGDPAEESSIADYIDEASLQQLENNLQKPRVVHHVKLTVQGSTFDSSIYPTDNADEQNILIVLNTRSQNESLSTQALLNSLTQELSQNRERMGQIEATLKQLHTQDEPEQSTESEESDPKELVVKTLRTSLITWERYTHKTKAELAEQSRCWRVYIDGTTAKTRTLDKYLSVKTLPAKPRWRAVIKTANYVLDHCELSDEDRLELTALVDQLNLAHS